MRKSLQPTQRKQRKHSRLYLACAAFVALVPTSPVQAEIRSFGMIGGNYTLVEASGPTRSDPEEFVYTSSGTTVRGSVYCREDQPIGLVTPGALHNFTVDTTTKRISFVLDGEPVSFIAPIMHARDGNPNLVAKGSVVLEESETPDPTIRIVYKTEAEIYFATMKLGDELRSEMTETTTYYHNNQPVLSCKEVYKVAGYINPPPPAPPDPTMLDEIFGFMGRSFIKAAIFGAGLIWDADTKRVRWVTQPACVCVRG